MSDSTIERVDALVIGAGISGIAAGYRLQSECPGHSYVILERRAAIGGTWDLFRYPGIRSDSDMYTLGYPFRPWPFGSRLADGETIRTYLEDTAREFGIDRRIRFGREVVGAAWSSEDAMWTVEVRRVDSGERSRLRCRFLISCAGYYRYEQGFTPAFPGVAEYRGQLIHPQAWREELEVAGARVVVIGSGATAVTLAPALAERGAQVTMLQRSPTYIVALPGVDGVAKWLQRLLPARLAYALVFWKNVAGGAALYGFCRRFPRQARRLLMYGMRRELPPDFDVETHFNPRYEPWDQRLCLVPDGDLFAAIRRGELEVVTDEIERFTASGLRLRSGRELDAELVVSATGLQLQVLGNVALRVDGREIDMGAAVSYRGAMFCDLPNLAMVFGYVNASWTLKADLICRYVCRVLNYMDARGYDYAVPRLSDPSVEQLPFTELAAGYIRRAEHLLPRQGARSPWRVHQDYFRDRRELMRTDLDDGVLEFGRAGSPLLHNS